MKRLLFILSASTMLFSCDKKTNNNTNPTTTGTCTGNSKFYRTVDVQGVGQYSSKDETYGTLRLSYEESGSKNYFAFTSIITDQGKTLSLIAEVPSSSKSTGTYTCDFTDVTFTMDSKSYGSENFKLNINSLGSGENVMAGFPTFNYKEASGTYSGTFTSNGIESVKISGNFCIDNR